MRLLALIALTITLTATEYNFFHAFPEGITGVYSSKLVGARYDGRTNIEHDTGGVITIFSNSIEVKIVGKIRETIDIKIEQVIEAWDEAEDASVNHKLRYVGKTSNGMLLVLVVIINHNREVVERQFFVHLPGENIPTLSFLNITKAL